MIFDLVKQEGGAQVGYPVRGIFTIDFQGLNSDGKPTFINEEGEKSTIVDIQSQTTKFLKYEGAAATSWSPRTARGSRRAFPNSR